MPHLALRFKFSSGGLKDVIVSLCGLLYSKNRTRGACMVPKGDRMEHIATGFKTRGHIHVLFKVL